MGHSIRRTGVRRQTGFNIVFILVLIASITIMGMLAMWFSLDPGDPGATTGEVALALPDNPADDNTKPKPAASLEPVDTPARSQMKALSGQTGTSDDADGHADAAFGLDVMTPATDLEEEIAKLSADNTQYSAGDSPLDPAALTDGTHLVQQSLIRQGNSYTIQSGDTLRSIAEEQLGDTDKWYAITKANPQVSPTNLRIGQIITLPYLTETQATGQTQTSGSSASMADLSEARSAVVLPGDTLYSIARKVYGDSSKWEAIYEANRDKLADPTDITVGMELLIPKASQ